MIQKKKTQVVKAAGDSCYRRKVKYSACNIHGRYMKVRSEYIPGYTSFLLKIGDFYIHVIVKSSLVVLGKITCYYW